MRVPVFRANPRANALFLCGLTGYVGLKAVFAVAHDVAQKPSGPVKDWGASSHRWALLLCRLLHQLLLKQFVCYGHEVRLGHEPHKLFTF